MASTQVGLQGPLFAHAPSQTSVCYSPDGKFLYTAGTSVIRKFNTASKDEPVTIDTTGDITGIVATLTRPPNDTVIASSEDCSVNLYSAGTTTSTKLLLRTSLPARAVALSPDGVWAAVASDDLVVKVVNVLDPIRVLFLREQSSSNKHVSWHPSGSHIAVSCTDGVIYVYSLTSEEPELIKKVDGVIRRTEAEDEASTKAVWCPDGRAFAAPTATRDIVVVDREGWERQRSFAGTHTGEITDLCWSPNGAFLASAGKDGKIVIWESRDMKVVATYDHNEVCALAWHPTDNTISFTTTGGKLFTRHGVVPDSFAGRLALSVRPAPLNNDTEKPTTIRRGQGMPGWAEPTHPLDRIICESSDSEGSVVGDLGEADANKDWLEDDDNAGYGEPSIHGKRKPIDLPVASKRPHIVTWSPDIRGPFQPTATPWVGERRYMCLNMIGCVWTVNQGTHNTVSVEFYDHETHRDFRFTDRSLFDKACLNENGTLFSSQPDNGNPAGLWYRPHETWDNRSDWRINLPGGESITSITLSENYIVACTSNGYVRTYTLFGVPYRIYRPKNLPVVTCASYRDYVLTMGNGPVGPDGTTLLTYTIENIKRDEVLQNNDVVALPLRGTLKSVFFSEKGDPMIYDSDGVLLVLQHWREPGQARWTPLLDTRLMERLADGARTESYWPVGVAQDKFHCIILKGGMKYPYFPRPLLSEFDLKIPILAGENSTDRNELEETRLRHDILLSLQKDTAAATAIDVEERVEISNRENNIDRALLQLMMLVCREDGQGAKALDICGLFTQKRTLDMASKVAQKYDHQVLAGKIEELRNEMDED